MKMGYIPDVMIPDVMTFLFFRWVAMFDEHILYMYTSTQASGERQLFS